VFPMELLYSLMGFVNNTGGNFQTVSEWKDRVVQATRPQHHARKERVLSRGLRNLSSFWS
jgi:hypothetical protein